MPKRNRKSDDVSQTGYTELGDTDEADRQRWLRDRAVRKALWELSDENREGGGGFQYDEGGIADVSKESLKELADEYAEDAEAAARNAVDALKRASPAIAARYTDTELLTLPIKAICGLPTGTDDDEYEYEQHYFGDSSDGDSEDEDATSGHSPALSILYRTSGARPCRLTNLTAFRLNRSRLVLSTPLTSAKRPAFSRR